MGEILDDAENEKEQTHCDKDRQQPRKQFSQILGRGCADAEKGQQVKEDSLHNVSPHNTKLFRILKLVGVILMP